MRIHTRKVVQQVPELTVFLESGKVVAIAVDSPETVKSLRHLHPNCTTATRPVNGQTIPAVAGLLLSMSGGASKGAEARNRNLTAKRRKEIAIKASEARWGKKKP